MENEEQEDMSCIWNVKEEDRHCKLCLLTHCDERKNEKYRRHGKVMPKMRNLKRDEEIVFEVEYYNACRTAASRLKENFGVVMITRREDDGIHVVRIS